MGPGVLQQSICFVVFIVSPKYFQNIDQNQWQNYYVLFEKKNQPKLFRVNILPNIVGKKTETNYFFSETVHTDIHTNICAPKQSLPITQ